MVVTGERRWSHASTHGCEFIRFMRDIAVLMEHIPEKMENIAEYMAHTLSVHGDT